MLVANLSGKNVCIVELMYSIAAVRVLLCVFGVTAAQSW